MYEFNQLRPSWAECNKKSILSEVKLVWIHSFPSPKLVAKPRFKNLVCPTIYLYAFPKGISAK